MVTVWEERDVFCTEPMLEVVGESMGSGHPDELSPTQWDMVGPQEISSQDAAGRWSPGPEALAPLGGLGPVATGATGSRSEEHAGWMKRYEGRGMPA